MKKLLLIILIGLLIALSVFIVLNGFGIGKIEVLSFKGIQQRYEELDNRIKQASKLVEKDYKEALNTIDENFQQLKKEKKDYEDMTAISSASDIQAANQLQRYEIETLWVKLGNYATSEGAVLKMDITKDSTNAQDNYNLNFTVNGTYIAIMDFISDIENDSTLGFKIEDFRMQSSTTTGTDLQGTFTCRDITIKDISSLNVVTPQTDGQTNENTTGNTTGNTTSNTTGNATNTVNSVNTNTTNTTNTTTNSTNTQ